MPTGALDMDMTGFAPGASPFRAKGLVYQGARAYYEMAVPGGLGAVVQALRDPALAAFFDQPVVAGGWYDALPIVSISRAAARLAGLPHLQLVRDNAKWLANRDINGVYRVMLKLVSAELVATRLPRASMQYFDFGTAEGKIVASNRLQAFQSGVPIVMAPWMIAAVEGFAPVALEAAGAATTRVVAKVTGEDGAKDRMKTVRIQIDVEWK